MKKAKEDKIATFIPLLHLSNRKQIQIEQETPFGEIEIYLRTKDFIDKELEEIEEQPKKEEKTKK